MSQDPECVRYVCQMVHDTDPIDGSIPGARPVPWLRSLSIFGMPADTRIGSLNRSKSSLLGVDAASAFSVEILDPQPGDAVLELCAAPGTKLALICDLLARRSRTMQPPRYSLAVGIDISLPRCFTARSVLTRCTDPASPVRCIMACADATSFTPLPTPVVLRVSPLWLSDVDLSTPPPAVADVSDSTHMRACATHSPPVCSKWIKSLRFKALARRATTTPSSSPSPTFPSCAACAWRAAAHGIPSGPEGSGAALQRWVSAGFHLLHPPAEGSESYGRQTAPCSWLNHPPSSITCRNASHTCGRLLSLAGVDSPPTPLAPVVVFDRGAPHAVGVARDSKSLRGPHSASTVAPPAAVPSTLIGGGAGGGADALAAGATPHTPLSVAGGEVARIRGWEDSLVGTWFVEGAAIAESIPSDCTAVLPYGLYDRVLVDAQCTHDASPRHVALEAMKRARGGDGDEGVGEEREVGGGDAVDAPGVGKDGGVAGDERACECGVGGCGRVTALQRALLVSALRNAKRGGRVVYVVCSGRACEGEKIVRYALQAHGGSVVAVSVEQFVGCDEDESARPPCDVVGDGCLRFRTGPVMAGLFIAVLERK